ncbi:hypothetical protein GCM10010313_36820 [Streptomyces violarus]|nr:hypothetical protein GCM10010313_36820 [Streptomyces violarus]
MRTVHETTHDFPRPWTSDSPVGHDGKRHGPATRPVGTGKLLLPRGVDARHVSRRHSGQARAPGIIHSLWATPDPREPPPAIPHVMSP